LEGLVPVDEELGGEGGTEVARKYREGREAEAESEFGNG